MNTGMVFGKLTGKRGRKGFFSKLLGLQSLLGRNDQSSGDALAAAAAPTEGGCGAEQGQGTGGLLGGAEINVDGF